MEWKKAAQIVADDQNAGVSTEAYRLILTENPDGTAL